MRVLIAGWPSFPDTEATAGDVLGMIAVNNRLAAAGLPCDLAFSPQLRPGAVSLADAPPQRYSHLVFVSGPAHGRPVTELHRRYAHCHRIAVGVSVLDPHDPAVTGFDTMLARDQPGAPPRPDLSDQAGVHPVPVVGVILTPSRHKPATSQAHSEITARLTRWINTYDCAPVPCDARLDARDWRRCATPDQFVALLRSFDLVVTTQLSALILALHNAIPALAVDPVPGGATISRQARLLGWPARLSLTHLQTNNTALRHWWNWCLSTSGRAAAHRIANRHTTESLLPELVEVLEATFDREDITTIGSGQRWPPGHHTSLTRPGRTEPPETVRGVQ
jgi:hypothetical protein